MGSRPRLAGLLSRVFGACCLLSGLAGDALAGRPRLEEAMLAEGHLERALSQRLMQLEDLACMRDVAQSRFLLETPRRALVEPLKMPVLADQAIDALLAEASVARWEWASELLDTPWHGVQDVLDRSGQYLPPDRHVSDAGLHPPLRKALEEFVQQARRAQDLLEAAFQGIEMHERQYAAAALVVPFLLDESVTESRTWLHEAGIPDAVIDEVLAGKDALDPRPHAERMLQVIRNIHFAKLLAAAVVVEDAVVTLRQRALENRVWPERVHRMETPVGHVEIGTLGNDLHDRQALLILNPGGHNTYRNTGFANGLAGHPLAVVMDLAGDDYYMSDGLLGMGAALWGVAWSEDLAGEDTFRAHIGQAAALFGVAGMRNHDGRNLYQAHVYSQAAAYSGVAFLIDKSGHDTYTVGTAGQAYAGVAGVAALIDHAGDDIYVAGRERTDYDRHWHRRLSLAQGFAIGMRPFAGGGVAVLLDRAGNDTYVADVYGQGASYWYALGMLLDLEGHDTYRLHEYGQGAGIHLSAGLLADFAGDDVYMASSLAQGAAHDYGVGILLELGGNDTYMAERQSQGVGIHNSLGLLLDTMGEDAYFARDPTSCQGAGHFSPRREYGSLSLLLDLANRNIYSVPGAGDGVTLLRPSFGVIYDLPENPPTPSHDPKDTQLPPDLAHYGLDELMLAATRPGDTETRRVHRTAAREVFRKRAPESLMYMLEHLETENMWFGLFADELVREMPAEDATTILFDALEQHARQSTTARYIIYLLGHHQAPGRADLLLPWLEVEETAGVTIRTLGKWRATNMLDRLLPQLVHTNEIRRITTINALHALADDRAVPHLIPLLEDQAFTVRYSAQRALSNLAVCVETTLKPVLESTHPFAPGLARELMHWKQPE